MTHTVANKRLRDRFPKSARIVSSDDFGRILRSQEPGSLRLGRDSVSLCAQAHRQTGRVRFGFTVGKRNVPRSVDRALVKRIMREAARGELAHVQQLCTDLDIGIDVSMRFRVELRLGAKGNTTLDQAKRDVRKSTQLCLTALKKRLCGCAHNLNGSARCLREV